MMQNRIERRGGFTLLETVVSTSIVAIAASITMGDFATMLPRHRLESSKSALVQDLRMARSEAIHRNLDVRVTFLSESDQYAIWMDLDRDGNVDTGESQLYSLDAGVSMSCNAVQGVFSPRGTFSSTVQFCRLWLQSASGCEAFHLTPNGHVADFDGAEDLDMEGEI